MFSGFTLGAVEDMLRKNRESQQIITQSKEVAVRDSCVVCVLHSTRHNEYIAGFKMGLPKKGGKLCLGP